MKRSPGKNKTLEKLAAEFGAEYVSGRIKDSIRGSSPLAFSISPLREEKSFFGWGNRVKSWSLIVVLKREQPHFLISKQFSTKAERSGPEDPFCPPPWAAVTPKEPIGAWQVVAEGNIVFPRELEMKLSSMSSSFWGISHGFPKSHRNSLAEAVSASQLVFYFRPSINAADVRIALQIADEFERL